MNIERRVGLKADKQTSRSLPMLIAIPCDTIDEQEQTMVYFTQPGSMAQLSRLVRLYDRYSLCYCENDDDRVVNSSIF